MVNFGPLAAVIVSLVWGTPANFHGFRVLVALLHGKWASAKLCLCSAGRPSRWIGPHSSFVCWSHVFNKWSK